MANEYRKLRDADLDKLARAVFGLLPRGALFNFDEESNLFKFIKYIADNSKGNMGYVSDKLMDELNPANTTILLDDWIEAAFAFDSGDECLTRDELNDLGDAEKRRILIARLLENGKVNKDYIESILNIWANRSDIKMHEFFPSRLDVMEVNDTINESSWVFADAGGLRIGESYTQETRELPEWLELYDIWGSATLSDIGKGIWTNREIINRGPRESWRDWRLTPTLIGDVEYDERTATFKLGRDGKILIPQAVRNEFVINEQDSDTREYITKGKRVVIGCSIYTTTHERDVIIADRSRKYEGGYYNNEFIYNGTGFYELELKYSDRIKGETVAELNPRNETKVRGKVEEWQGVMIYAENYIQSIGGYFVDGETGYNFWFEGDALNNDFFYIGDGRADGSNGETAIGGINPNRNGPLYVRDIFVAVLKGDKSVGFPGRHNDHVPLVADEISTIERKYDDDLRILLFDHPHRPPGSVSDITIGTAFYNSTFTVVDEEPVDDDLKTLELIKCILKRILPLSIDYNTGKLV